MPISDHAVMKADQRARIGAGDPQRIDKRERGEGAAGRQHPGHGGEAQPPKAGILPEHRGHTLAIHKLLYEAADQQTGAELRHDHEQKIAPHRFSPARTPDGPSSVQHAAPEASATPTNTQSAVLIFIRRCPRIAVRRLLRRTACALLGSLGDLRRRPGEQAVRQALDEIESGSRAHHIPRISHACRRG